MRLTDASVALRPRTAWEAIDLGLLLSQRHGGLLFISQALVTLPVFALISLCFWQNPALAGVLFWWLKPLFERLPLHIFSRALFGQTPTLYEALRALPRLLWPQLLASLLWRRFSPWRSFTQPVSQLEGLKGKSRRARLNVLSQKDSGAVVALTVLGIKFELVLWLGLCGLIWVLLPEQIWSSYELMDWKKWFLYEEQDLLLAHLSNLTYALILVFWQPIYAACGFTLYLNRRTHLEGWDIEIKFRALHQRKTGSAYALLLIPILLLFFIAPQSTLAQSSQKSSELGPADERLLQQSLSSKGAQDSIKALLEAPPFTIKETLPRWRLKKDTPTSFRWINGFFSWISAIAKFLQILLWAVVIGLLALLLWRWRHWLSLIARPSIGRVKQKAAAPAVMFGLEVTPQSLPDDLLANVRRLWPDKPRQALGLFYRALLSRLLHQFNLPLKSAHTEGEVLALVYALQQSQLSDFSMQLTDSWQRMAYGHQVPPANVCEQLCQGWQQLFEQEQSHEFA